MFICVVFQLYLNLFDHLKNLSVAKNAHKKKETRKGANLFFTPLYILICFVLSYEIPNKFVVATGWENIWLVAVLSDIFSLNQ